MTSPTLYTTQQAADTLGLTTGRVRQLARALGIGRKVGRDHLFTEQDIERLQQRKTTPGRVPRENGR